MAIRSGTLSKGISLALFTAGPIFMAMLLVYDLYRCFPHAIEIPDPEGIPTALMTLPIISVFGALISLPANLIGGLILGALSERYAWLRMTPVWTVIGLLAGIGIGLRFSPNNPQIAFALTATSTVCALICRHWVEWEEPEERLDFVDRWPRPYR